MKTKFFAIGAVALLSGGIALHMGPEPKCLIKLGIIKKAPAKKTQQAMAINPSEVANAKQMR